MTQSEMEKMYALMEIYSTEHWSREDVAKFNQVKTRVLVDICREFYREEGSFKVRTDLVKKHISHGGKCGGE